LERLAPRASISGREDAAHSRKEGNMNGPHTAGSVREPLSDTVEIERIRAMPKEVAVLLIVAGIGGLLLPGPVGTPFLILGGVMLWPRAFERLELFMRSHFPSCHHQGVRQIRRFLDDLEKRYPTSEQRYPGSLVMAH
jgi:hypothetical protein